MEIDVLTLFPEMFEGVLSTSILKIAREKELARFRVTDIRDFTEDKHRKVDDRPFGGGPGMVMRPEPVFAAVEHVQSLSEEPAELVLLTPQGETFTQKLAYELTETIMVENARAPDALEGMKAFLERREPRWGGE